MRYILKGTRCMFMLTNLGKFHRCMEGKLMPANRNMWLNYISVCKVSYSCRTRNLSNNFDTLLLKMQNYRNKWHIRQGNLDKFLFQDSYMYLHHNFCKCWCPSHNMSLRSMTIYTSSFRCQELSQTNNFGIQYYRYHN